MSLTIQTPRPRVLLCSLDGVRPDAIQVADTPTFDRLACEGAASWSARTVMPSCTLPCHTSMLRGVDTARHGITSNQFQPLVRPVPSLIEVARQHGRKTGFFYNWEELRDLAAPGSLDASVMWGTAVGAAADQHITDAAITYLEHVDFDLLFLYLGWPDECGHKEGWMSRPYLDAVENADACVGRLLAELSERDGRETVSLIVSDHGGHARTHGTEHDDDMLIPWILHGPGVRTGIELTGEIRIYDTCVTLASLMGLPQSPAWEGRVVDEALS